MSSGERSPKRQRLESYSPASPPLTSDTKAFVPPQTPPPSVRMSPSWQSQSQTVTAQTSSTSSNFPTPSSTAGFQGPMAGREAGGDSARHTPASEADNYARKDGDGDDEMMDRHDLVGTSPSAAKADYRRSDHEREEGTGDVKAPIPGAQALYKLSIAPIAPSQPHLSDNLIELYDLKRIQASVARRDPVTGEKINKLRKSYENKVKALGLEGRNKAQPNEGELAGLVDSAWDNETEGTNMTWWDGKMQILTSEGKALSDANSHKDLFSKLDSALNLLPGRLSAKEHKDWQNILGLDDAQSAAKVPLPASAKRPLNTPSAIANTAPAAAARSSAPVSPHNSFGRPGRSSAKRRYDDSSFEGYGYEEDGSGRDEMGRRGSNAKRQKRKDFPQSSHSSASFTDSPNTSNGNMVGVRSS